MTDDAAKYSTRTSGIDIADADMDDDELARVLEALLLVVDTPVTAETLASVTEQPVYRITAKLRDDGRRVHRPRQRDRPARGRRRLADVHPVPVRAVCRAAAAGRRRGRS